MSDTRRFPVMEIFGPTIQGEGDLAGHQTMFVRFGGCDYRCTWCDSLHAVLPESVAKNAYQMSPQSILNDLLQKDSLGHGQNFIKANTPWVTLSGGNPAMHKHMGEIIDLLKKHYKVTMETQGSIWWEWLKTLDALTVSPKPPSSGMADKTNFDILNVFAMEMGDVMSFKVPIFDLEDLAFATKLHRRYPNIPFYLSVGNPQVTGKANRADLLARYRWLSEEALKSRHLQNAIILPQLHVLMWGNKQGV